MFSYIYEVNFKIFNKILEYNHLKVFHNKNWIKIFNNVSNFNAN